MMIHEGDTQGNTRKSEHAPLLRSGVKIFNVNVDNICMFHPIGVTKYIFMYHKQMTAMWSSVFLNHFFAFARLNKFVVFNDNQISNLSKILKYLLNRNRSVLFQIQHCKTFDENCLKDHL